MKFLVAFLAFISFGVSEPSAVAPVLTGSTIYGSSPAVTAAPMHQAGSASTATIANSGSTPTSCSITSGDPSGNFQCVVVGGAVEIEYTSTGATNLNGSSELITQTLTVTASNTGGTSSGVSVSVNVYNDGALQAPVGGQTPQASLFSGYAKRPPWLVPGTDYALGIPTSSLPLKVPGVNSLPAGATLSGTTINMTGTNIVLDGWDLSGSNGIQVALNGCVSCTIKNSKLVMGTTQKVPVLMTNTGTSSNLTLLNDEISQSGLTDSTSFGGMVYWVTGGGFTMEYCYLHDAGDDFLDFTATGTDFVHHNLMLNNAQVSGGHPDFMQTNGGTTYAYQVDFNSWVDINPPATLAGQGLVFGDNGFDVAGTNFFNYNVTISKGAGLSMSNWVRVFAASIPSGVNVSVSNNYVDITEANGFNHDQPSDPCAGGCSGGGTDTWAGNVNMVTGATFTFTQ